MKKYIRYAILLCGTLLVASCGGGSAGGGLGEFTTVSVTASVPAGTSLTLASNVVAACPATTPVVPAAGDTIIFNVTSTLYPGVTSGLPVHINGYTITFTPKTSASPALSPITGTSIGTVVLPGVIAQVPVEVVSSFLKSTLISQKNFQVCAPNGVPFEYFVTIAFAAQEEGSWVSQTITASMNVAFTNPAGT